MSHNGSYDSPNAGLRLLSAAISPHIRGMSANQMIGSDLLTNDKLVETGSNWQESTNDSKVGKRRLFESEKVEECRNLEQLVEMVRLKFCKINALCTKITSTLSENTKKCFIGISN